jgi:xylose isomerase
MRSYLILKDKVARFNADPEIQDILSTLAQLGQGQVDGFDGRFKYSSKAAAALKNHTFDVALLRRQGYRYERLDQLTTELLLGVR